MEPRGGLEVFDLGIRKTEIPAKPVCERGHPLDMTRSDKPAELGRDTKCLHRLAKRSSSPTEQFERVPGSEERDRE
jgi:hypothetical protein